MKTRPKQIITLITLFICSLGFAQSYVGHSVDNYSGVHGVILNPSSVVDSPLRTDINLFSISAFLGSDYFSSDLNTLIENTDGFNFSDDVHKYPKNGNNFFLNLDALGPSFMFKLSPRSSIAFTTRARAFFNLNRIDGTLFESVTEGFDENEDFDFEVRDFNGNLHIWSEVGLTYGRIFLEGKRNFLKGGVTLKYLRGAGGFFLNAPTITGYYDATAGTVTTTGTLSYGSTQDFDSDNIDVENLSTGLGGDVGFTYEYRPGATDPLATHPKDYKFKLGVSVTDFGNISYSESRVTTHDLDKTVDANSFEGGSIQTTLEEEYGGTEEVLASEINLPTALHLLLDYQMRRRLFISVHGSLSLIADNTHQANRIINSVTATPRLETQWLSLYLPVSLRQYEGLAMGAGLRLGPLTVGSGSFISNYFSDASQTTDMYVGLKIPFYR